MTKIYLIRHAEAEGNLYRISQGQYDSAVTELGYRQIEALKKRFEPIHIDAVYASDLYRTCATAQAVCAPKGLPLHRRKDLREICVGEWEQKPWGELCRDAPEQMENFMHRLDLWHVPGAEAPETVRDRILGALEEIGAENDGKTVAVFSHGSAIRILLATLQGYSIAQVGQTHHGQNTAVSLLEAEDGKLRIVFRDDSSHLEKLMDEQPRRHPSALEPGLCFTPVQTPEQTRWACACAQQALADGGAPHLKAGMEPAGLPGEDLWLTAELDSLPAGVLRLSPRLEADRGRGWITLYCMDRPLRKRGYGVQMLGQAVQYYRPMGRETLCLALPETASSAQRFFSACGFAPSAEKTSDGREIWTKSIAFRPIP